MTNAGLILEFDGQFHVSFFTPLILAIAETTLTNVELSYSQTIVCFVSSPLLTGKRTKLIF